MKKIIFKTHFETPYFQIEKSNEKDSRNAYYRLSRKASVICCLLDVMGNLILVDQFRPTIGSNTLEFPSGSIDGYEKPSQAAIREILEETGFDCKLISLGTSRIMFNRENVLDHFFFGFDAVKNKLVKTEEGIKVKKFTLDEFKNLILVGKFQSVVSLGMLQLINLNLNCNFLIDKWQAIQKKANKVYKK